MTSVKNPERTSVLSVLELEKSKDVCHIRKHVKYVHSSSVWWEKVREMVTSCLYDQYIKSTEPFALSYSAPDFERGWGSY